MLVYKKTTACNSDTLPINCFDPIPLLKVVNASDSVSSLSFPSGEVILHPNTVTELPASRLKKLISANGVLSGDTRQISEDSDPIATADHDYDASTDLVVDLKRGLKFKNTLQLGNIFIVTKASVVATKNEIFEPEDSIGPSAEFFNYFDANFNPDWGCDSHEGPDAELNEFHDLMM